MKKVSYVSAGSMFQVIQAFNKTREESPVYLTFLGTEIVKTTFYILYEYETDDIPKPKRYIGMAEGVDPHKPDTWDSQYALQGI